MHSNGRQLCISIDEIRELGKWNSVGKEKLCTYIVSAKYLPSWLTQYVHQYKSSL